MNTACSQPAFDSRSRAGALRAFTLIEMVLAIAIAGVILTAITTVFFGAIHLRTGTIEATENVQPVDRAIATIKNDLLGIAPPGNLIGVMGTDVTGVGIAEPIILEFYTTTGMVSDDSPFGDVQKIDYILRNPTNPATSSGKDLIRGVTRNLLATVTEAPEAHVVIGDVESFRMSYYDGTNWTPQWSTTLSNTPVAIKCFLDFTRPKSGKSANPSVQFVVPIVMQSTNSTQTNTVSY